MEKGLESKENIKFVSFQKALTKLGQAQYLSRFVNPDPVFREDDTPFFEGIRIKGNPDDYHELEICESDVQKFIELWFKYKKETNFLFRNNKLEDYL